MSDMSSGPSLDISFAFDVVWHPALLSKLFAYGIQSEFHTWLTDLFYSPSQCVALKGILLTLENPLSI